MRDREFEPCWDDPLYDDRLERRRLEREDDTEHLRREHKSELRDEAYGERGRPRRGGGDDC